MRKIKAYFIVLTVLSLIASVYIVNAENIPREAVPLCADEESIIITEELISPILEEVCNGMGYAEARAKSNNIIFNAVITHNTNGYGFGILSAVANNAIFEYRDMYLRPDFYYNAEITVRGIISDVIAQYANGEIDYNTAVKKSYEKIYQSINQNFSYDEQYSIDSCYRDIPAIDSSMFTVARKLLINSKN